MAARMTDKELLTMAGIREKSSKCDAEAPLKVAIRKQLRIIDEQDAVNRFTWYNLPEGLNSRLLERVLYYRGQGMFFKMNDKFYFLPYALDGGIDLYGRFEEVTPLPFNGSTSNKEEPIIKGLTYSPVYDVVLPEDFIDAEGKPDTIKLMEKLDKSCVLLKDYTEQISQTNIPRQQLQDPLLDIMSECIPFMRTNLINSTGVQGLKVGDASEYSNVLAANKIIDKAALEGNRYVPITATMDLQDLSGSQVGRSEEYMLAMQSLDNYRLSLYGLENGGLFQKKSHILQAEQELNMGNIGLVMRDCLQNRQEFCDIVNSIWGLGIWCEASEVVTNIDRTGDSVMGSDEDGPAIKESYNEEEPVE